MTDYRDRDGDMWLDGDQPGTVSLVALNDQLSSGGTHPAYTNVPFTEADAEYGLTPIGGGAQ